MRLGLPLLSIVPGILASAVSFEQDSEEILFPVVDSSGGATPILTSPEDWPGVHRAAADFASDIEKVTSVSPGVFNSTDTDTTTLAIIVGTLGKSTLIDSVLNSSQLDVSSIRGKWESYLTAEVDSPIPGIERAYVIIGSDKRGTIYALYDLSEQFGVSPWYWWADVPTTQHTELYLSSVGFTDGPPTVQYRGIFLNDEQPALQNWAMEKFTNGTGSAVLNSPFNSLFYAKVFELLLRLKGNYLWPAMWGSAFAVDDPLNQPLADYFGIAMGTSHQEPMMRSSPNEFNMFGTGVWNYTSNSDNIYDFWVDGVERARPYESVYSLGMRGAGDLPLEESTNIALLQRIIEDQREILADVYETDVSTIPQIWTLYQEVEGYYEDGMRVPEDVTLLWADDTWGNVRRFPTTEERNRTGGAGIYYHFDLVGGPRSYKWATSTQISRVFEQMSLAVDRNATKLWIVNAGDLKPYERETEFFLSYGWNTTRWSPTNLNQYMITSAKRDFDISDDDAVTVASVIANLTRFNSRRKPELWNSTTFSLTDYREADTVLADWDTLEAASTAIHDALEPAYQPSFYQLVQYPVAASANLGRMYIAAGMSNLRASQAFLSANTHAALAEELFESDYDLGSDYHELLDDIGYYYWQQPMTNSLPSVSKVQSRKQALAGPMRIAIEGNRGAWPGDNPNQCAQGYNCPPPTLTIDSFDPFGNRYFDIGHGGGLNPVGFTISANVSWLTFSSEDGSVTVDEPESRVYVSVSDWDQAVSGGEAIITVEATVDGQKPTSVSIMFVATNTQSLIPSTFAGYVASNGVIAVEAAHSSRNTSVDNVSWIEIPDLGRTVSSITPWPRTDANYTAGDGPSIEYDFFTFGTNPSGGVNTTLLLSPSLNANGRDRPLGIAVQIDDLPVQSTYFIPEAPTGTLPPAWGSADGFVANNVVPAKLSFEDVAPGAHTFKIFMIEPAVVVQKIIIDYGGLKNSYLGPPESKRI